MISSDIQIMTVLYHPNHICAKKKDLSNLKWNTVLQAKTYRNNGFVVCDEFIQGFLVGLTACVHNGSMDRGKHISTSTRAKTNQFTPHYNIMQWQHTDVLIFLYHINWLIDTWVLFKLKHHQEVTFPTKKSQEIKTDKKFPSLFNILGS